MELFPYQKSAVDLITSNRRALIAYEMGLGKSAITINAMESLMSSGDIKEPVLIVGLSSLLYQWESEIGKFAPEATVAVMDGTPKKRREKQDLLLSEGSDYVVATYDMLVRDMDFYLGCHWGAVVLDECVAIKSFKAQRSIVAKRLRADVRVGLTGTPITNGMAEELFSIMEFVDRRVLGPYRDFESRYIRRVPAGWIVGYRNLPELHHRISGVTARKLQSDEDVKGFLPEVLDMPPRIVHLGAKSSRLYKRISADCESAIQEARALFGEGFRWDVDAHYGSSSGGGFDVVEHEVKGKIMQCVSAMRMLCDHPALLVDSALEYESGQGGSSYCASLLQRGDLVHLGPSDVPPKIEALKRYLTDLLAIDPAVKVVIFTSFRRTIKYIAEAIGEITDRPVVQYHGGLSAKEKDEEKRRFQSGEGDPASPFVFLSSDAGGQGVDLPQASVLINYNLPWSMGTARQRNSRIIRASSKHKQVRVERFLTDGTLEIRQWEALSYKGSVSDSIIDGAATNSGTLTREVGSLSEYLWLEDS